MNRLLGIISILLFCPYCNGFQHDNLEEEIQEVMAEFDAIGVSVVVVKGNKICYQNSFGYNPDYKNDNLRKPIPENGIYWLASVSKTFISTAIMQLVEKKKLKLDDDVNNYLKFKVQNPKFPNTPITVRMLLCHRSSLNDSQNGWTLKMMEQDNEKYEQNFNNYEPGTNYDYCNLGYNLLGAIIENVTGLRFYEYIREYICKPLGLDGSFNLTQVDSTRLVRAYSYNQEKKKFYIDNSIYDYQYVRKKLRNYDLGKSTAHLSPAGGMRLSAMDLAKWMMVHMNYGKYGGKKIIKKKTELAMWEPQGTERKYAFAFSQYNTVVKGENFMGMTGGSHGIHSLFFFNPKKKYGFVVICNGCTSKTANGGDMNYKIVRILYKHFIQKK